ncbi:MAG: MCE family protein [Alphaproteobacteria bacterium]|nr:MCE family protein [Alphaproteobacteria bacterium]
METRASYVIVGGFVLALLAGLLVVVLWVGGSRTTADTIDYKIVFTGSVTGLRIGNAVLYRGVPVGSVSKIAIDPDTHQVIAIVEVNATTPIKVDTEAFLELQLLTNVAVVQLVGGNPNSPPLVPAEDQDMAQIRAGASAIEELTRSAPELVADLNTLIVRAQLIFSDQNINSISGILSDVNTLTSAFATNSDEIDGMIGDISYTLKSLSKTMDELGLFVQQVRAIAEEEGKQLTPTLAQVQTTLKSFSNLAKNLDEVVSDNKRSLQDFSSTGLYELSRFMTEARALVSALQRLAERLERDPARFLFGDSQRGVNVQ